MFEDTLGNLDKLLGSKGITSIKKHIEESKKIDRNARGQQSQAIAGLKPLEIPKREGITWPGLVSEAIGFLENAQKDQKRCSKEKKAAKKALSSAKKKLESVKGKLKKILEEERKIRKNMKGNLQNAITLKEEALRELEQKSEGALDLVLNAAGNIKEARKCQTNAMKNTLTAVSKLLEAIIAGATQNSQAGATEKLREFNSKIKEYLSDGTVNKEERADLKRRVNGILREAKLDKRKMSTSERESLSKWLIWFTKFSFNLRKPRKKTTAIHHELSGIEDTPGAHRLVQYVHCDFKLSLWVEKCIKLLSEITGKEHKKEQPARLVIPKDEYVKFMRYDLNIYINSQDPSVTPKIRECAKKLLEYLNSATPQEQQQIAELYVASYFAAYDG